MKSFTGTSHLSQFHTAIGLF
ncbi:hypothetical protein [Dolichospermum circinale]